MNSFSRRCKYCNSEITMSDHEQVGTYHAYTLTGDRHRCEGQRGSNQ